MNHENSSEIEALLQDWAARHTLSPARSETIRQTILLNALRETAPSLYEEKDGSGEAPATQLTIAWWNQLFVPLTAALKQSTGLNVYRFSASMR
jgi:hypothetical protein